jgi:RNA polymerase sigma-70 factor (sigma-E family)
MTFEEFLASRLGALLRYAAVVSCDRHLAEDVVQDVLLRAHGRWERIGAMDSPEAYLRRMVLNEFLSWRRRRRPTVVEAQTLEAVTPPSGSGPDVEERDAMLRLLAGLPPRQRTVIALRYYEDLSDDQIADLMGCRPVTVRSQASRALATLRGALGEARPRAAVPLAVFDLGGPR